MIFNDVDNVESHLTKWLSTSGGECKAVITLWLTKASEKGTQ